MKQSSIVDSTMEAEYIAASEATKSAVWLKNFLMDLEVVPSAEWLQIQRSQGAIREKST